MSHSQYSEKSGFALPAALLVLLMLSAISIAVVFVVSSETRMHTTDLENTQAFYATEAAMEKMMTDMAALYVTKQSPTSSDIANYVTASDKRPALQGISYREYAVTQSASVTRNISSGPNQGLMAQIIPTMLSATARQANGTEVRMLRNTEVALIPVFQFGIFSDGDLSYFPGPNFDFAGRVHTNGNLFLSTENTTGLIFHSKVSALGEVIRRELSNGFYIGNGTSRSQPVRIPKAPGGCDTNPTTNPNCRTLGLDEGSRVSGPTSAKNTNWNMISTGYYSGWLVNGETGAKKLSLPFVGGGKRPIELIRLPEAGEDPSSDIGRSRDYNLAEIRILLADDVSELPGGTAELNSNNIKLANEGVYVDGVLVPFAPGATADKTFFAEGATRTIEYPVGSHTYVPLEPHWIDPADAVNVGTYLKWPLIGGYLRIERRRNDGSWDAVTREWLELGFVRGLTAPTTGVPNPVHPNAILIFQKQADRDHNNALSGAFESAQITLASSVNNWFPINLYDTREGEARDGTSPGSSSTTCALGGIMNAVELDVGNLKKWLDGTIGTSGNQTDNSTQNGYILYFSDRRGMQPNPMTGLKDGTYGFEDVINPPVGDGTPDGAMDPAEDVNQNGTLDAYGITTLGDGFIKAAQGSYNSNDNVIARVATEIARKNRVTGPRHALKLIDGGLGNVPVRPDGTGGFTVASENPVYVFGNYNANDANFTGSHAAASIIADAVTILSGAWSDLNSFLSPIAPGGRNGTTTYYRMAVAAGKNRSFPRPGWATTDDAGTDGGTHNFLRYLENWGGNNLYYKGSLVSLYSAEYAVGIYKCCTTVYSPPTRHYSFDTDFLDLTKLPPGTPRFTETVNLGYRQVLSPE
jgi:Tfp pilus assembly protein PilX